MSFGLSVLLLLVASVFADDLNTIQHIVIFMQENRAFDHYFGTLHGVRGFNDRTTIQLNSGKPVWFQSVNSSYTELPWHMDTLTTSGTCAHAPQMDYPTDIQMWNRGYFDRWNSARDPGLGMSYFMREDLDFYYELADAFTICDQYHQSTFTQTNPNRLHLFSGSNGLSAGYNPVLDNGEPHPGWKWPTFAETLEEAGVDWKVYQESDNFDDNGFEWFATFQEAQPGSPLYDKGKAIVPDLVQAFEKDVSEGTLRPVSWIIAPEPLSEHANNRPAYGEDLTARLLKVLGNNPEVFKKTVFFLNYDEQGGFFDHIPPPTPPANAQDGKSTVTTVGEITKFGMPIGLGFRVPMIVISPWTQGGFVNSEVFDHTSVIKFVEKRFGVSCPNISPWRRVVSGDLLSTLDFSNPNYTWPTLPDTSDYVPKAKKECNTLPPPHVPSVQSLPVQEKGTKKSRPLPYTFHVDGFVDIRSKSFNLTFTNQGKAGVAFQVYDLVTQSIPKKYTVESIRILNDGISLNKQFSFSVHAPNGWVRQFSGDLSDIIGLTPPVVTMRYSPSQSNTRITLSFNNTATQNNYFIVTANAYNTDGPWNISVGAGAIVKRDWPVFNSGNWYDFSVVSTLFPSFTQRFMGRVETGFPSISDPAMAGL